MTTRDTFDMFHTPDRGRFGDNEQHEPQAKQPRVTGASDLVDLDLIHHLDRDTAKAVFCSTGRRADGKYLPKSQVEIVETGPVKRWQKGVFDQPVRVTMPEWLAKEKGLV